MPSGKHSLLAGIIVFLGVGAVALVVYNAILVYMAMPSRADVINFAGEVKDSATETGIDVVGSLVPDAGMTTATNEPSAATAAAPIQHEWLSPEQRRTLTKLGIDESKLPSKLTPELEACFVKVLGEVRVEAIKLGDSPTVVEGMKAATCL
jgi:hypothetical protein